VSVQRRIEEKITAALAPSHLEVINESHMHSVPPGSESHFKLVIVSESFTGTPRLGRQRAVNGVLAEELKESVHALSMATLTEDEWRQRGGKVAPSPLCHGGSKSES
jgi:BolA protein